MKKPTPPYLKHRDHPVVIRPTDKHNGYYYFCEKCQVWVGWLSKQEVDESKRLKKSEYL